MTCPKCGKAHMVGRIRVVQECVDVPTGDVVRRDDPTWLNEYECGLCGNEWKRIPDTDMEAAGQLSALTVE